MEESENPFRMGELLKLRSALVSKDIKYLTLWSTRAVKWYYAGKEAELTEGLTEEEKIELTLLTSF